MITTVADLLEAFRQEEAKILDKEEITHPPTIGNMYEGLTRSVLERAIPDGLDLGVVSGFITNKKGHLSKQIDCMLVQGEGKQIPHTDNYVYDIENVLAVVEVKKNLYSNELDEAYKNLLDVSEFQRTANLSNRLFTDAYRQILQSDPDDYRSIVSTPLWKYQIGLVLKAESVLPIRIAFGYHGFRNEFGFRSAFLKYLEKNIKIAGYGPAELPNLIVSDQYSLIKLNGMPYGIPRLKELNELSEAFGLEADDKDMQPHSTDFWLLYASYSANPMVLFLELIWTRLVYQEKVSNDIFGLDLDIENLKPLILAKAIELNKQIGWFYEFFELSRESLKRVPISRKWQPVEIDNEQAFILNCLINHQNHDLSLDLDNQEFLSKLRNPDSLNQTLEILQKNNLIYIENHELRLLTRECMVVVLPDGRIVAGDNSGSRFTNWLLSHYQAFGKRNSKF